MTPSVAGNGPSAASALRGPKRKRNNRACDRCYRNACKCSPGIEGVTCRRCEEQGEECTYNRPVKRRGPPPRRPREEIDTQPTVAADAITTEAAAIARGELLTASTSPGRVEETNFVATSPLFLYSEIQDTIKPEIIQSLIEFFHHTIYPIRPYFHWPTFQTQIHQQLYRTDWGVFVVTMAVCALTAGRLYNNISIPPELYDIRSNAALISARCYDMVVKAMPSNVATITDYCQAMKANAILASVCLQSGDLKKTVAFLGDCGSLLIMHGLQSEINWPASLTEIEREEMRRLIWGVYQQEQYVSLNFGIISRQREAELAVLYPAEVFDDEDITATSIHLRSQKVSFLRGWNFCSDIYRLCENLHNAMKMKQETGLSVETPGASVTSFLSGVRISAHFASDSLHLISKLHRDLPQELKTIKGTTGGLQTDRYGLTAANILFTTFNIKMRLVGNEKSSIHVRCAIASELLDELGAAPSGFFHSSSTGSLYHLAHIGHMLGSVIQNPISAWTYLQIRNILLVLSNFLEKIESGRNLTPNLAAKLRAQIGRIDHCMQQTSQSGSKSALQVMGQSLLLDPESSSAKNLNRTNEDTQRNETYHEAVCQYPTAFSSLTRSLGTGDEALSGLTQRQRYPGDTSILPTTQYPGFTDLLDVSRFTGIPNSGLDIQSLGEQSTLLTTDFFDGWPILAGQTDAFGTLESLGQLGEEPHNSGDGSTPFSARDITAEGSAH